MEKNFIQQLFNAHQNSESIPSPQQVCEWLNGLLNILFPELAEVKYQSTRQLELEYQSLRLELFSILDTINNRLPGAPQFIENAFMERLPDIRASLLEDAEAILTFDPAATSLAEVIRSYPGFFALAVYRFAHTFHQAGVPLIPRILTEYAHGKTGIDIHPGAQIGRRFCIDHGTGVVIGETVVIGDDVKVYQGVTLGALSVKKDLLRVKRHPTIEDNVVIYAGATILGGNTVIGHDSIIGGNVWLVKSVEPHSRIYYQSQPKVLVGTSN